MWERLFRHLYRGDWPAKMWGRLPGTTEVRCIAHELAILPPGSRSVRVGYASDLHIGPTTPEAILHNAESLLAAARPDVLLLGGDYVFLRAHEGTAARLERFVRTIGAPATYAVFGNHDLWTDHARLEAALLRAGARMLINTSERQGDVVFLGIDDPWTGEPDPGAALAAAAALGAGVSGPARPARIALVHSPDAVPWLQGKVDLLVCGHTHGGQIALPGGRPVVVPSPASRRWPHGRFDVAGTTVLVSRGLGGIEVPVRAWAPPDVLVIDLLAKP